MLARLDLKLFADIADPADRSPPDSPTSIYSDLLFPSSVLVSLPPDPSHHASPHASLLSPAKPPPPCLASLPIRFFCNNINKSNSTTHVLLNKLVDKFDILLIQEPWKDRIGTSKNDSDPQGSNMYGEPQQREWTQFVSLPAEVGKSSPTRSSIYISKRLPHVRATQCTDILEHADLVLIHLSVGDTKLLVINIYNDSLASGIDALMAASPSLPDIFTIITGDFNLHHESWTKDDIVGSSKPKANEVVNWLEDQHFNLLNTKGEVTFIRSNASSVLDLTWANDHVITSDLISDWQVNPEYLFGQDHIPITWTSHFLSSPPEHHGETKFTFHEDQYPNWARAFQEKLDELIPNRITDISPDQWHATVDLFQSALSHASNITSLPKKGNSRPSPWFNNKVKAALTQVRQARSDCRIIGGSIPTGPIEKTAYTAYRKAINRLRSTVKKAKRDWAMKFCQDVRTQDVWKLTNWYKGIRKHKSPPLSGPNGMVYNSADKFDLFFSTFFVMPPDLGCHRVYSFTVFSLDSLFSPRPHSFHLC